MAADNNRPNSNSGLKIVRLPQKRVTYRHIERDVRDFREDKGVTFEADSTSIVCIMKWRGGGGGGGGGRRRWRRRRKRGWRRRRRRKLKIWDYIQNERLQHLSSGAHAFTREREVRQTVRRWKPLSKNRTPKQCLQYPIATCWGRSTWLQKKKNTCYTLVN